MKRWHAVWSLKRGIIDPPEPLEEQSSRMATQSYACANLEGQTDYSPAVSCTEPRKRA